MKRLLLMPSLILVISSIISAQRPPRPTIESTSRQQGLDRQAEYDKRSTELRMNESFPVKTEAEARIVRENIQPLYRDATKEELKAIEPDAETAKNFADVLKQKNTGLLRLVPEKNCGENTKVVSAAPECTKYTMPGGGASYSFRMDGYRIRHLGDLNYTGKSFRAFGALAHGIFVSLGDAALDKVDLKSDGMDFLSKFQPAADFKEAGEIAVKLDAGIKDGNFTYKNLLPASENTTYALRSIAYQGLIPKTVQGISYNELDIDKRRDVIIVFRVVRRDADGSVTILWKELANKIAPKLKENK
ncbi:MAG TPA: hypothetical protein VGC97_20365 [Pyrinomonadaceae bacterium]|jgi:hypothetical protein